MGALKKNSDIQHLIPDHIPNKYVSYDSNGHNNLLIAFNSSIRINITGLTFNIHMTKKYISSVHFNRGYSNTTCAISGAGTSHPARTHGFISGF
jgi:hypothetical protein